MPLLLQREHTVAVGRTICGMVLSDPLDKFARIANIEVIACSVIAARCQSNHRRGNSNEPPIAVHDVTSRHRFTSLPTNAPLDSTRRQGSKELLVVLRGALRLASLLLGEVVCCSSPT